VCLLRSKNKFRPRTGHEGPKGERRCSSTLSLTSALDGEPWLTPRPGRFTPGNETLYLYRRLYCAVQTETLNRVQVNLSLYRDNLTNERNLTCLEPKICAFVYVICCRSGRQRLLRRVHDRLWQLRWCVHMPETGLRPSPVCLNTFSVAKLGQDVWWKGKSNEGSVDSARP
jgi:hypothetical protein